MDSLNKTGQLTANISGDSVPFGLAFASTLNFTSSYASPLKARVTTGSWLQLPTGSNDNRNFLYGAFCNVSTSSFSGSIVLSSSIQIAIGTGSAQQFIQPGRSGEISWVGTPTTIFAIASGNIPTVDLQYFIQGA